MTGSFSGAAGDAINGGNGDFSLGFSYWQDATSVAAPALDPIITRGRLHHGQPATAAFLELQSV